MSYDEMISIASDLTPEEEAELVDRYLRELGVIPQLAL